MDVTPPPVSAVLADMTSPSCCLPDRRRKLLLRDRPYRRLLPSEPRWERIPKAVQEAITRLVHGQARWPLYLWGDTGVGKTWAAWWVVERVREYCAVTLERLADRVYERDAWYWRRLADRTLELAVIDEIGLRTETTDREYLALKRAADLLEWRPTIWISNLAPEELRAAYDDRIFSRLCCGVICQATGPDQRFSGRAMPCSRANAGVAAEPAPGNEHIGAGGVVYR